MPFSEMTDRLTQLQDAVNQLGEYFCNSIGVLQSTDQAPAGNQQTNESKEAEENTALFSSLIARTAQDIEILINSLPNQDSASDHHDDDLRKLEADNRQAAMKLKQAVEDGELLLKKIREALEQISSSELAIDATTA